MPTVTVLAAIATAALIWIAWTAHRRHRARSLWEAVDLQFRAYRPDRWDGKPKPFNLRLRYALVGWTSGALSDVDVAQLVREFPDEPGWDAYWAYAEPMWEPCHPKFLNVVRGALQGR